MNSRWTGLRRVEFEARVLTQHGRTRQRPPKAARRSPWLLVALAAGLAASYALNRGPSVRVARTLDFGRVTLHRGDTLQIFSIANVGTSPLVISLVEPNGDAVSDFVMSDDHCTGAVLQPHSECPIAVRFSPATAGRRSAYLMIRDNASNSPQQIQLSGIGTVLDGTGTGSVPHNIDFQFEPSELEFYSKGPSASTERPLLIRNVGSAPLRLATPSIEGNDKSDFRLVRSCANVEIPPGDECQAIVRFTPTRGGSSVATVIARATSAGSAERSAVLHGTSASTEAIMDLPHTVNFTPQMLSTETTLQFKVVSSGSAPLNIYKVETSGDSFSERDKCSGQMLAPGQSCLVAVSFHPQREGDAKGSVVFQSNAGNSPETVAISGVATAPPRGTIELNPSEWNFYDRSVTASGREPLFFWQLAKSFSVKAGGTVPVILGKAIIVGQNADDFRLRSECGPTLDSGTTCQVKVGFLPQGEGLRTAELSFTGADKKVALSGTGKLPTSPTPVEGIRLTVSAVSHLENQRVEEFGAYKGLFRIRTGRSAMKTPFMRRETVGAKVTLQAEDQAKCAFQEWRVNERVSLGRSLMISLDSDTEVVMVYKCQLPPIG